MTLHALAVLFRGGELEIAARQHQENEGGNEIEINQSGNLQSPSRQRAKVSDHQSQRDRQVDVERAHPRGMPGPADEVAATHQHRQRRGEKRDQLEKSRKREIPGHAQIARQREPHRIQHERPAKTQACAQLTGFRSRTAAPARRQRVAEGHQLPREFRQIHPARLPAQMHPTGRRMCGGFERAGLTQ